MPNFPFSFKLSLKLGQSSVPNQDSRSLTYHNFHASVELNRALPTPPCRLHTVRHSLMTLWYDRLKQLEGYRFDVLCYAVLFGVILVVNTIITI